MRAAKRLCAKSAREEVLQLPMALREAYLCMHRATNELLKPVGITADQYVCLLILKQHGTLIQNAIVKHANSDPNTVKAMLQLLEQRGLVMREVDPSDRRARRVSLTDKGAKAANTASERLSGIHDHVTQQFSAQEAQQMYEYLQRYAAMMSIPAS